MFSFHCVKTDGCMSSWIRTAQNNPDGIRKIMKGAKSISLIGQKINSLFIEVRQTYLLNVFCVPTFVLVNYYMYSNVT